MDVLPRIEASAKRLLGHKWVLRSLTIDVFICCVWFWSVLQTRELERTDQPLRCSRDSAPVLNLFPSWATMGLVAEWRNWQTQWTQNPPRLTPRVGSSPTLATRISLGNRGQ
jgi:hypothetical protein